MEFQAGGGMVAWQVSPFSGGGQRDCGETMNPAQRSGVLQACQASLCGPDDRCPATACCDAASARAGSNERRRPLLAIQAR